MGPSVERLTIRREKRREICSQLALAGSEALALVVPAVQRTRERMLRHARDNRTPKSKSSRPENAQIDPALYAFTGVASPFPALSPANALPVPTSANMQSATAVSLLPMCLPPTD